MLLVELDITEDLKRLVKTTPPKATVFFFNLFFILILRPVPTGAMG